MTETNTTYLAVNCELRAIRASVVLARSFVAATLHSWGLERCREAALAITSELMTNAVEVSAPGGIVRIHMSRRPNGLWLKILDGAAERQPFRRRTVTSVEAVDAAESESFGGWGLQLTEYYAERVWTERAAERGCKWVCAVIDLEGSR
ncbi:ATP-binding protein [Actinomadura sp. 9N407]|uniref:ATP-binding protein n=1 Tax=Actinomadura sp. 9N407 TaxID=3375154 RepID=UPI0037A98AEC